MFQNGIVSSIVKFHIVDKGSPVLSLHPHLIDILMISTSLIGNLFQIQYEHYHPAVWSDERHFFKQT